jgi:sucrose phosphorylase
MKPAISQFLVELYGEARVGGILIRLPAILDRFRSRCRPQTLQEPGNRVLTQQDALLIAYADQVRESGQPPLQTLAEFCTRHLKGIVSGVHLLPFYPSSSDDGFSVKDFFAVEPGCGTWEDIALLGTDFDLMFDGVFNHVSAQGLWFQRFLAGDPSYADFFVTVEGNADLSQVVRPRALPLLTEFSTASGPKKVWTTFSADQVDLNFKNPEVLLAVLEALLFYAGRGASFIRLDAIAFLWKEIGTTCLHLPQTHTVIQLMRAVLDEAAPDTMLITETNVPHSENISYFGDGTNEAQLVYNFALPPLLLHTLQTGNAQKLTRWAQSLTLPSNRVTFFNFLASHDGIGLNPVRGILNKEEIDSMVERTLERGGFISYKDMADGSRLPYEMNINYLDALSHPAGQEPLEFAASKFLAAHAILLSLQGVPGIYFHSLFGSRGDRPSAESSGIPRRINREKIEPDRLEAELAEAGSLRHRVWHGMRTLLQIRARQSAFHPQAGQQILSTGENLFAVCRIPANPEESVVCLHNVSSKTAQITSLKTAMPPSGIWTDLLTGRCFGTDINGIALDPYQTMWLQSGCTKPDLRK